MHHPFEHLETETRMRALRISVCITIVAVGTLGYLNGKISNSSAPQGIVSLAFAGTPANASRIIESWNDSARLWAVFGLGFDFLVLTTYSTTLALLCVQAAIILKQLGSPLHQYGMPLAWGQWLAALFDVGENSALVAVLLGIDLETTTFIARWCAILKFSLIGLGIVYGTIGFRRQRSLQN